MSKYRGRYNRTRNPWHYGNAPKREADNNAPRHTEVFNTWGEYLARVTTKGWFDGTARSAAAASDWDLRAGWEGTVKMAREGWPEGTAKVKALSASLTEQIASTIERYDPYYSLEAGGQLDVARYLEGEPECWIRYEEITTTGTGIKLITLSYNNTASGAITAETLLAKGSVVVALIECLEYAGHRVKVQLASAFRHNDFKGPVQCIVKLKDFNETVDVARLAFALAHPACFRRLGFSWAEHLPKDWVQYANYGGALPIDVTPEYQGDIHIPHSMASDGEWENPSSARDWVLEALKKQGISLREDANG